MATILLFTQTASSHFYAFSDFNQNMNLKLISSLIRFFTGYHYLRSNSEAESFPEDSNPFGP